MSSTQQPPSAPLRVLHTYKSHTPMVAACSGQAYQYTTQHSTTRPKITPSGLRHISRQPPTAWQQCKECVQLDQHMQGCVSALPTTTTSTAQTSSVSIVSAATVPSTDICTSYTHAGMQAPLNQAPTNKRTSGTTNNQQHHPRLATVLVNHKHASWPTSRALRAPTAVAPSLWPQQPSTLMHSTCHDGHLPQFLGCCALGGQGGP